MINIRLILKTALIGAVSKEMPRVFKYSDVLCKHTNLLWEETDAQLIYLAYLTIKLKSRLTPNKLEAIDKKSRSTSKFKRTN